MKSLIASLKREFTALLLAGAMAFGIGLSATELVLPGSTRIITSGNLDCTGACEGNGQGNCSCSCSGNGSACTC
jgi:hypothetical protein